MVEATFNGVDYLLIGGNSDFGKRTSSDPVEWRPTIFRFNKASVSLDAAFTTANLDS